eukprot:scaffold5.g802.t1
MVAAKTADLHTPLLAQVHVESGRDAGDAGDGEAECAGWAAAASGGGEATAADDLRFYNRVAGLLRLLRPYPALLLSLLSILESLVVAQVGKVAGSFYLILVDRQPGLLLHAMLHAAALYAAATALHAAAVALTGWLAWRWRRRLARVLHAHYCAGAAFFALRKGQQPPAREQAPGWEQAPGRGQPSPCARPSACSASSVPPAVDNPDQRMTADTAALCDALAGVAGVAAAAPFKLCYYSWLTGGYVGWRGLALVYAFFLAAVVVQRWVPAARLWVQRACGGLAVVPVARMVFRQEAAEGDLRATHARLREFAPEAAQWGGGAAEARALDSRLGGALAAQARLVAGRTGLAAATRAVDYVGALLNYVVVAAAVFAGAGDGGDGTPAAEMLAARPPRLPGAAPAAAAAGGDGIGGDGGRVAQFVSNASFATLTLIYSLTELLDLADKLSQLAGLTARVGQLREALAALPPAGPHAPDAEEAEEDGGEMARSNRGPAGLLAWAWRRGARAPPPPGRRGKESRGRELGRATPLAALLQPPRPLLPGLEVSVHALGRALEREVRAVFPGAPPSGGRPLLAVVTFQHAAGGVDLAPDRSAATLECAAAEMDRMLDAFLRWHAAVRAALQQLDASAGEGGGGGWWCDAVDPRTGAALGGDGGGWSEVAGAHALLGYERRDTGVCPVVAHPVHGTSAYPATIFTDAPFGELQRAMAAAAGAAGRPAAPSTLPPATTGGRGWAGGWAGGAAPLLLSVDGLTVRTPAGQVAVQGLTLHVHAGEHLLMVGPNGCGKSTLLRTLCGLHPAEAGAARLLPPADAAAGGALGGTAAVQRLAQGADAGGPRTAPAGAVFVPQRPLAAPGAALWQQVVYPSTGPRPSDAHLGRLLAAVGLAHLAARGGAAGFDAAAPWGEQLSPGELQRLAFARVLHARPALAVLDEPTSAVNPDGAAALYAVLAAAGVTCVSVGQRGAALRGAHGGRLLALDGRGGWRLEGGGAGDA